ncbi:MAG TPA: polysaccharide biosynthesis/export family protein [Acetobacteraceae bacterium]
MLDQARKEGQRHFDLVEIDPRVVTAVSAQPVENVAGKFEHFGKPPVPAIGIGDSVSISIWEASGGGLFGSEPAAGAAGGVSVPTAGGGGHSVTIPEQVVGADGGLSVPYAGRVRAAGRTPEQVQQAIQQALADRAIEPQVVVTVTKQISDDVTVSGELVSGARIPLSIRGDRLLDVIASVGGAKSAPYDTYVRLARDGQTTTIAMDRLISDPQANIYVWPGDTITLIKAPRTFSVFGATLNNPVVPFDEEQMNLAQAIAKAGGLEDLRADPAGVFLFRFEPLAIVKTLGVADLATTPEGETPVLYHLSLRDVNGYFLAERFPMHDNDLIYVANAPLTELQKFFTLLGTITGPVISGAVVSRGSH